MTACTVECDGQRVTVTGTVAEAIARLVAYAPALGALPCWKARIDVKGGSVRLVAEAPVPPPAPRMVP